MRYLGNELVAFYSSSLCSENDVILSCLVCCLSSCPEHDQKSKGRKVNAPRVIREISDVRNRETTPRRGTAAHAATLGKSGQSLLQVTPCSEIHSNKY
jgi:hypothetical protein